MNLFSQMPQWLTLWAPLPFLPPALCVYVHVHDVCTSVPLFPAVPQSVWECPELSPKCPPYFCLVVFPASGSISRSYMSFGFWVSLVLFWLKQFPSFHDIDVFVHRPAVL